jgi:hypothetical protein
MEFKGKKIILALPHNIELWKSFEDNIIKIEAVPYIIINYKVFKYKSFTQRINNFFRKTILKDKEHKEKLRKAFCVDFQTKELNTFPDCDYALVIRPDLFEREVLELIKKKVGKIVAYQWDGIYRYPNFFEKLDCFNQVFLFDKNDLKDVPNSKLLTNFYFDCYFNEFKEEQEMYDLFFIGALDSRSQTIINLCLPLYEKGFKIQLIFAISEEKPKTFHPFITYTKVGFSYKENLKMMSKAKAILDFNQSFHNGLSLRPFEALGFNKKLITTNKTIKDYDLYTYGNVYVLDNEETSLENFLLQPINCGSPIIKEKYSFTNWIKNVFEIENRINIS